MVLVMAKNVVDVEAQDTFISNYDSLRFFYTILLKFCFRAIINEKRNNNVYISDIPLQLLDLDFLRVLV